MKYSILTVLLTLSRLINCEDNLEIEDSEIICPDSNPLNCYPKLFEPSIEWKEVKEGQIIPVGLDIRLDLDNLKKMAKLTEKKDSNKNHEIVVSKHNNKGEFDSLIGFIEGFVELTYSKTSFIIIKDHFEQLIEWSSDIETGVEISHHFQSLLKITGLYNKKGEDNIEDKFFLGDEQYSIIQDMTYMILSSTFRNNIEAQKVLLEYLNKPEEFLLKLVEYDDNNLIIKRKLGLLGSLINNNLFDEYVKKARIEKSLIMLYSKVDDYSVKERIMNLLEDMKNGNLDKREEEDDAKDEHGDDGNSDSSDVIDSKYADIVQRSIVSIEPSSESEEYKEILDILHNMRDGNGKFPINNNFLDWLDKLINYKKSIGDKEVNKIIELRHQVFGNRLGSRRDYDDEL